MKGEDIEQQIGTRGTASGRGKGTQKFGTWANKGRRVGRHVRHRRKGSLQVIHPERVGVVENLYGCVQGGPVQESPVASGIGN